MNKTFTFLLAALSVSGMAQQQSFDFTGEMDSIQIPNCVESIQINAWGAQGANAAMGGTGGYGGHVTGYIPVTAGQWVYINVGGQDGYNGGGQGGSNGYTDFSGTVHPDSGGNGGGASDVRIGGKTLADRVMVAGGGGGGAHEGVWPGCQPASPGGDGAAGGSMDVGSTGSSFTCNCTGGGGTGGTSATQVAGGTGGVYNSGGCGGGYDGAGADGELGIGGDGNTTFWNGTGGGGGGGGGYYGGGAGGNGWDTTPGGGGGGGSSFTGTATSAQATAGVRQGDGKVTITFVYSTPIMDLTVNTSGITMTAAQSGVTYQWLNCSTNYSAVSGANSQSYTATANGDYAVQLNNGNGCIDTSACVTIAGVGIDQWAAYGIQVYPVPAQNQLFVDLSGVSSVSTVQLVDANGKVVFSELLNNSVQTIDVSNLDAGIYVLQINRDEQILVKQIVKD